MLQKLSGSKNIQILFSISTLWRTPRCTRSLLTQAFIRGPTSPPLLEQTVGQHFSEIVSKYGDRRAVISRHQNLTVTYDELDQKSNALARGLVNKGVRKGDRCAVMLGNNIEFAITTYALFKLGAVLVPLNPAFNSTQVISALQHLSAAHLIASTETNLPRKPPRSNIPLLESLRESVHDKRVQSKVVPSLFNLLLVDNSAGRFEAAGTGRAWCSTSRFEDVLEDGGSGNVALADRELHPDDVVNIQFTSGTTSTPKAAMLSHKSILNNGKSIGDRMLLTPNDVVCCPPPLFHCFGSILGFMATATHASTIVFPTEAFDPMKTLRSVQDYSCTALYGVPTMFLSELELLSTGQVARTGLSQLRTGIAAGSSIPAELMRKLHRELNLTELTICYGMTETSPVSAMTTTDDPLAKRINSVGRLLPHVAAKVVDPLDWSRVMATGERGELAVSGYLLMKGYFGDEGKSKEVLVEDEEGVVWMHTGDEASIDEDGYVKITGRIKDLIIRGGENIHPLEVEDCLLSHPAISEVSVVGLPDEHYGEIVAAFISRKQAVNCVQGDDEERKELGTDEVREWVRKRLSHHLVPKLVFWVDEYPKTASGKIQKFQLRRLGIEMVKQGKGRM